MMSPLENSAGGRRLPRPAASASLADRNRYLMELAVESGHELYSPDMRLCRQCHPTAPYFNGYTIGQVSLEYALALLETGTDAARAEAVVARTLDFQDRDRRSESYGNFIWMAHWTQVRDRNAVTFMTPNYFYIWQRHADRLSAETRRRLEAMFPAALEGVNRHPAQWRYTNIFLLKILSWLLLGKVLDDPNAIRHAADQWDIWRRHTEREGFCEYNSPCYTAVQLYTLAGLWEECPDAAWREDIEGVLKTLYTEFAANLHPASVCLSGPASRAYPMDYLDGSGLSAVLAFQQFGFHHGPTWDTNGGLTPFVVNFAIHTYEVPEAIRRIALERGPYTVEAAVPGARTTAVNFVSPRYTVGAACTLQVGAQGVPVIACRESGRHRRTVFLRLAEGRGAEVLTVQRGALVLGRVAAGSEASGCRAVWGLGPWRHMERAFVQGAAWSGGPVENAPSLELVVQIEGVLVGLRVQAPGVSLLVRDMELIGEAPLAPGQAMIFVLEVADAAETGFERFSGRFLGRTLMAPAEADAVVLTEVDAPPLELDAARLRQRLNDPEADVYQVLHRSPFMTWRRAQG